MTDVSTDTDNGGFLAAEGTKRTLGSLIVIALTVVAIGVLTVVAAVAVKGDETMLKSVVDSLQPGTLVVAAISAIAGMAAGIGISNRSNE